jgi:hypothetical protein
VLRFTCRFGGWKHHTRRLDPPVGRSGYPPQHPRSVNDIQRTKATSAITNPWSNPKACARPGSGHQAVLTNPVRCCNAFAHTPTSPTSLDSRCSAIGPESEAPDNGQATDAGQAAASIHRMHHENERPVGGAKIGRVRITRFGYMYRLLVPSSA